MRKRIYQIIEKSSEGDKLSLAYDIVMLVSIIASIIPLTFAREHPAFIVVERVTVTIFIIDYLLRWLTADYRQGKGKWSFVLYPFTGWAIIDLLSILPGLSLVSKTFKIFRVTRLLRLLRVLRIFKLIRYTDKIQVLANVIRKERKVLLSVLVISLFYVFLTALIMFNTEPHFDPESGTATLGTFFDALYWATVTLTTVGYGDVIPVTDIGRLISMISSLFGVAIIALPSGVITASYLEEIRSGKQEEEKRKNDEEGEGEEA